SDATHRTGDVENGALTTEGAARDPAPTETAAPGGTGTQRHTLHLRHLRRRHRRARPVPRLGSGEGDVAPPGETASGEQPPGALNEATAIGEPTAGETTPVHRRHRRRRTRYPLVERAPRAEGEPAVADGTSKEARAEAPTRPLGTRPPRSRNRRRRRPPSAAAANGAAVTGDASPHRERAERSRDHPSGHPPRDRERERGARDGAGRSDRRDDQRGGQRSGQRGNQRDRGRRGPPRRGRGLPERKAQPKLYSFDSIVDRGFEDVEEDGETKRVHWTIVKRTTADQISRKPISAVYVLQREGNDSEFPNLGAARSAVNKTIVHPEKLTRSKEEYAAEKSAKR